jgi:hypothetical protein
MTALSKREPDQEESTARRPQKLNIFPLDVERVIEGLEGSIECADYQFHEERGFGTVRTLRIAFRCSMNVGGIHVRALSHAPVPQVYTTEKEAETIKNQLLQAYNREKRSKQRDSLGSVSGQSKQPVCGGSLCVIDGVAMCRMIDEVDIQSAKKPKAEKPERAKKEKPEKAAKAAKSSDAAGEAAKKLQVKEPKKRKLDEETKQQRAEERAAQRAKLQEARRLQKEREKKIQPIRRNIKVCHPSSCFFACVSSSTNSPSM